MGEPMVGRLLTSQEVADLLNVPVRTLQRWRYVGKGPQAVRVGKHARYRPESVVKWLREQEGRGPDAP
jgi:excisionase family DNA binding protein